jgi:hypothetical protein
MLQFVIASFLALLLLAGKTTAQPQLCVDVALVLAVDGSGSVNDDEYEFQKKAIAAAFRDDGVKAALDDAGTVAVSAVFWGDGEFSTQSLDWFLVYRGAGTEAFAHAVEASERIVFGNTDIGNGLWAAMDMLSKDRICAHRSIINVSGDGRETVSPKHRPTTTLYQARLRAQQMGVTINALAITEDDAELATYYAREVVHGTGGFTMEVTRSTDFAVAIRKKLVRELSSQSVASIMPSHRAQ